MTNTRCFTKLALTALTTLFATTACVQENPTEVGGALIPGGEVVSFEVVLPASQFLVQDSAFSGYTKAASASFSMVANKLENVVDANALMRFSLLPSVIAVRNTAGTIVNDTAPKFVSGLVVFKVDTIALQGTKPAKLTLFRTAEEWDVSATWDLRVDSGAVHLPWQTKGGTRGPQVDTATWTAGDSIVFRADSATIAFWNDSTKKERGAILVSGTPNSRVRILSTTVHVNAKSSIRADTTVVLDIVPSTRTFVFNPTLPNTFGGLRAGGIPSWRGFLSMRPDLGTLTFPCSVGSNTCTVQLDSAHLTLAQLVMKPTRPPAGFLPEDTVFMEARSLGISSNVPLERSPTGARVSLSSPIAPTLFSNPQPSDVIKLDITSFIAHLTNPNIKAEEKLPPVLTLIQVPEAATFGFMAFDGAPSLRLVLTAPLERK